MLGVRPVRLHRWLALATTLTVLSVLVACTSDDDAAPAAPVRTTVEKVWTVAGIDPVSAVRNVGGVAVVYGTTPAGLLIYGLDPATGAQLWSKQASLPVDVDQVYVTAVGDWLTYLRPTGSDRISQVVIADAATGADHAVSAPRRWNSSGAACSDDESAICLNSYVQVQYGDWDRRSFRVDVTSGATTINQQPDLDAGYSLGFSDLFYDWTDDQPKLTRRSNNTPTWSRPVTDVFGPEITSLSWFSHIDSPDDSYSVVSVMNHTASPAAQQFDLATDTVTAAFNLSDGSPRWRSAGTILNCFGNHPLLRRTPAAGTTPARAFRCAYTGSAVRTVSAPEGTQNVTSNLNVTLESINPDSGSVNWSANLGEARTLAADSTLGKEESVLDDEHLFVPTPQGGLVIDTGTGETRPPTSTDSFWCEDNRTYTRPEAYFSEDTKAVTVAGRDGVYRTCNADGIDAPVPTSGIPEEVSTSFSGESRVIAINGAVSGYLVPPDGDATGQSTTEPASPSTDPDPAVTAAPTGTAASQLSASKAEMVWQATGYEPVTAVRVVGGTAIVYATIGSDLMLIGLDPATGAERWRRPTSAAGFAPTTKVAVTDLDGSVAYLRPTASANERTQLVLADPVTGADRWATEERWWTELPSVCEDDESLLCGSSYESKDDVLSVTSIHIDRASGGSSIAGPTDKTYETIFGNAVRVNGAPTETIGILQDNALLWSAPVKDLIGGDRGQAVSWYGFRPGNPAIMYMSSTIGWLFDRTIGYPQLDLAANLTTVAMNYQTGEVLWREPGTSVSCRGLLGEIHNMSTPGSPYPALRCRYAGQLNSTPPGSGDELTAAINLSVTIERVDLQTGEAIWSIPVGDARSLAADTSGIAMIQLDDHRILIKGQVIDLDAGTVRPPAAGETFWCPARQSFRQGVQGYERGLPRLDRAAGGEVYQCDANTSPISTTPTDVPLAVSTMTDDGLRLVSTPAGVIAYRVPL